jgi:NitT/TauT family transport system permease protein
MKARDAVYPLGLFGLLVIAWQAITRLLHVPEYLVPSPVAVAGAFDAALLEHALTTFGEALLGFLAANLLAVLAAIVFVYCPPVERSVFPLAIALKTTPLVALAPLLVIWLGTGLTSKVAASMLICFFPALVNGVKGLRSVERESAELFASYRATAFETFWRLRLPNSLPYLLSAFKISSSLAVVGAIVGEFVGASRGLGYLVLVSSYHMETAPMFAAIVCAAAIGLVLFWSIGFIERRVVFWQKADPS